MAGVQRQSGCALTIRLLGRSEIRRLAKELEFRPRKSLGQNFVHDANTVRRIVSASGVNRSDHVLEVGPGLGSLTLALLDRGATVSAVEIDPVLAGRLPKTVAEHSHSEIHRLTVLNRDVLSIGPADLAAEPTAVVANLPYNVAVPALLHLLAEFPSLRTLMVMVQAEVAERLAAEPGGKEYGVPSVKVRFYGQVRRHPSSGPSRASTPGWCASTGTQARPGPPTRPSVKTFSNLSTSHLVSGARHLAMRSSSGRVRATNRRAGCWPPVSTRRGGAKR
jgi:16S rRNA (adenine1518-N6/adenine1519-N6)-dimethyltransferase